MRRRPRSSAARRACGSAIPDRWGGILIRGEAGHDIIPALYPRDDEIVIDKPGKGAFYATELGDLLQKYGIENLLVCGVTTEVCVNTTVREANDRGYRCVVLADCCASYFPEFHEMGLKMIKAQGGIFGWVSDSERRAAKAIGRVSETIADIVAAHRAGTTTPAQTVARSFQRIRDHNDPAIFISLRDEQDALAEAAALANKDPAHAAALWRSRRGKRQYRRRGTADHRRLPGVCLFAGA